MSKPQLLEDEIGRKLAQAHASGELQSAPGYGQPFTPDVGWEQAPQELRMGFKILKDAGCVPPEVELFHQRAQLREALALASSEAQHQALAAELSVLEQRIALRLDALRTTGSL
ncbi:MAG: DUF1992 domain-containing protein [Rhodoferax sp.]